MTPEMINIDQYIMGFVAQNPYTILLFLALIKGVAKLTPTTTDDKVSTLLSNMFGAVNPFKKKNRITDKSDPEASGKSLTDY